MYIPVGRRWFTGPRSLRLGAIGPPLAVAAALVAALVWFDKVWIPAQQQYLNERNLRVLHIISGQIKAKVDNFDLAIDHAIDSFPIQNGNSHLLQRYVKLFSPELEIVTFDPKSDAWKSVPPADPPNVQIERDEGRNYLYLGYLHEAEHRKGQSPVKLIARGDIDQVAAPLLTRSDFDALLLVDDDGATIAQQSSSGLELTNVQKLRNRAQDAASTAAPTVFTRMRGTTNMAIVTIGAADYMLYTQPVQLSLMHQDTNGVRAAEEWTLCGLVRLNRFRAASSTIPTTYWLWCGAALALISFAIPLLKLRILSPRERLRRIDGVSVAAASFMMMALAAFIVLDLRVFGTIVPAAIDNELRAVAASISTNVRLEADAIARQMTAFEDEELWRGPLGYEREPYHSLTELRVHLEQGKGANITFDSDAGRRSQCNPSWSCRSGVLPQLGEIDYPFFKLMTWEDDAGWQRVKWSTSPVVTPFISVADAKSSYFDELARARRLSSSQSRDPDDVPTSGVSVIMSPNTGEKLTLFWRALEPLGDVPLSKPSDLMGESLATTPISLTAPVLPHNVQFTVLDRKGRVLFHSDSARSLAENFFQESEDSPKLRSLVAGHDGGATSARYLGRPRRFYVMPLDMTTPGDPSPVGHPRSSPPEWSLVVFQDAAVAETANIQTINLALSMFAMYALALGVIWALLGALWPSALMKWLWPDPHKGLQYRSAAIVGAALGLICFLVARFSWAPAMLLSAGAVLIVVAMATMFLIVRAVPRSSRTSARWPTDYFLARASVLFLLAAVPAALCFHVAYDFHSDLVVKRAQSRLASDLDDRARRIGAEVQGVAICSASDPGLQPCAKVGPVVERRTMKTLWDVDIPVSDQQEAAAIGEGVPSTIVRSFLKHAYRPYNDTAADLLMTSPFPPGQGLEKWRPTLGPDGRPAAFTTADDVPDSRFAPAIAPPWQVDGVFWLVAVALMGAAYALARCLLKPLFALDMNPRPTLTASPEMADDASLLVIGPPGSRRTVRFRRNPCVRIFDVRSLTFVDDPMAAAPSSPVPVSSAADQGPTIEEQRANWAESIYDATSQPIIVALDHLEYRFNDENFRGQLLECLELAVYGRDATIWCGSVRDPIELLEEMDPPALDRGRWARLFETFRHEHLGLAVDRQRADAFELLLARRRGRLAPDVRSLIVSECEVAPELLEIGENLACRLPLDVPMNRDDVLAEISRAAVHFYEALWDGCAIDQRVALHQLAEEGLVNPNNPGAVSRLLSAGLVRRDPTFRIMNETFRRFVTGAASPQAISAWEREGVLVPWGTIATTGVTVAFGLAGLLLLTQEQLVDAWIRYVPTLAPSIPTVWRVLASAQKGRIEVTA